MAKEQLVMDYVGALASPGISSGATSLTLASNPGSALPSTGNFRIRISDPDTGAEEWIQVSARSGATLSQLDRGIEGSPAGALAWSAGAPVEAVLTVEAIENVAKRSYGPADYFLDQLEDGSWAATEYGDWEPFQPGTGASDIGNTINYVAANRLTNGGKMMMRGAVGTAVPVILPDSVHLMGTGWNKPTSSGELTRLYATGAFPGGSNLLTADGDSSGADCILIDGNSNARAAVKVLGNRCLFMDVAAWNGTVHAVDQSGAGAVASDGRWDRCDIRYSGSASGVTTLFNQAADNKYIACHIHGGGTGANDRVLYSDGHHAQYVGTHIEGGNADSDWSIYVGHLRTIFGSCSIGETNGAGMGEMFVDAQAAAIVSGCTFFPSGLAVGTADMIKVQNASTSHLTLTGNDVTYDPSPPQLYRNAVSLPAGADVIAVGNRFAGTAAGPFSNPPKVGGSGSNLNTWNNAAY